MSEKKVLCVLFIGGLCAARFFAQTILWDEYIILRDAMYNSRLSASIWPLYDRAVDAAKNKFTDGGLLVALSKCEYMLGRTYSKKSATPQFYAFSLQHKNYAKAA